MGVETRFSSRRAEARDRLTIIYKLLLQLLQTKPETDLERFTRLVIEAKELHFMFDYECLDVEIKRLDAGLAFYTLRHNNRHLFT